MSRYLLLLCLASAGCGSSSSDTEVAKLKEQIAELRDRVSELESSTTDTSEMTQFGDLIADRLFVRTVMVVDENGKPRICLSTNKLIDGVFQRTCANPSILIETANNINANLTMTNAAGNRVVTVSSYPGGGSAALSSARDELGGLQFVSLYNGPEIRQLQKPGAGGWINLKQTPVDNNDTDYR